MLSASVNDHLDGNKREGTGRSGLYVDVENLQADGRAMVQGLIENWPDKAPRPTRLSLYVRADQVDLWRLWSASLFTDLEVKVNGTQHFSLSSSKNSADIAIATNAMADLVLQRVTHVVVFSDDSDFISLYAAIRDDPGVPFSDDKVPFLWVVTDREDTLSATVKQFFPSNKLHIVEAGRNQEVNVMSLESSQHNPAQSPPAPSEDSWIEMAEEVLPDIPVGSFKSTDCQPVIRDRWPNHPLARAGGAEFGTQFKNNIWPILEVRGVTIDNPERKPIRYEMTEQAKHAEVWV